jgi:hypothetical protein
MKSIAALASANLVIRQAGSYRVLKFGQGFTLYGSSHMSNFSPIREQMSQGVPKCTTLREIFFGWAGEEKEFLYYWVREMKVLDVKSEICGDFFEVFL